MCCRWWKRESVLHQVVWKVKHQHLDFDAKLQESATGSSEVRTLADNGQVYYIIIVKPFVFGEASLFESLMTLESPFLIA